MERSEYVMKTFKIFTLGCKVNQYDTQNIKEQFLRLGFKEIDNVKEADVCVINTCTVTSTADSKSRHFIHYAHRYNPKATIIVTGCYAQLNSDEIAKIPGVTYVVKNQDWGRFLNRLTGKRRSGNVETKGKGEGITNFSGHTRAFLKIQDGCNNFCSYCKVPLVRGNSRSRPIKEIIHEAEELAKNGFKEIVLTGICLGAYGKDLSPRMNLTAAVSAIEKIDDLLRVRLSSIEASDVSDELIRIIAESEKICRHLHIPIQSGDDEILKKMNRNYSHTDYQNLVKRLKSAVPEIAVTTDVLVGFPGESERNFNNTFGLIKKISPLKVHIFPYSRRSGTPAADNFKEEIAPCIIKKRIFRLESLAKICSRAYKKKFLNKKMDVLVEGSVKECLGYLQGYTDNYIKVLFKSRQDLKNNLIPLKLKKIKKDFVIANLH